MEERTPYISIRYPEWFQKKYPVAMRALKENSQGLTTPFDIHETLLDSLSYTPEKEKRGIQENVQRQTLLRKICDSRNCEMVWKYVIDIILFVLIKIIQLVFS